MNFLEKSDMTEAGVPSEDIEVIMNAVALKKLQDRRRGRKAVMM